MVGRPSGTRFCAGATAARTQVNTVWPDGTLELSLTAPEGPPGQLETLIRSTGNLVRLTVHDQLPQSGNIIRSLTDFEEPSSAEAFGLSINLRHFFLTDPLR